MKNILSNTLLLRLATATVFLSHSLHGIFTNNDVNDFGNLFLNQVGFAPFGVFLAWSVILSQVVTSIFLVLNKFAKVAAVINILILLMGIYLVHWPAGWFVVGGGNGGMEFSFVLVVMLVTIIFPDGFAKK